jgi:hypothetical protein
MLVQIFLFTIVSSATYYAINAFPAAIGAHRRTGQFLVLELDSALLIFHTGQEGVPEHFG